MKAQDREDFYSFWEKLGYSRFEINNFPFSPEGLNVGDVLFVKMATNYSIGDVVAYKTFYNKTKVHRLTAYNSTHFSTLGDWFTTRREGMTPTKALYVKTPYISTSFLEGKVIFRLPRFGLFHIIISCLKEPRCKLFECLITQNCHLGIENE
jgi:hypothetical protein